MDLDDTALRNPDMVIGEILDLLSVAELEQRIQVLESEIVRIQRRAIAAKPPARPLPTRFFRR